jgi:hypothetical protein
VAPAGAGVVKAFTTISASTNSPADTPRGAEQSANRGSRAPGQWLMAFVLPEGGGHLGRGRHLYENVGTAAATAVVRA